MAGQHRDTKAQRHRENRPQMNLEIPVFSVSLCLCVSVLSTHLSVCGLLWLRSSDVGAAGEDFTLHRLLDVSPHSARRDIQRRVQSENLEDVMMIRMAGW